MCPDLTPTQHQHLSELETSFVLWQKKPLLRKVYGNIHGAVAAELGERTPVLELGSGIGSIRSALPACICTDIVKTPWVDRVESAYAISCEADSVGAVIMIDVFHHLRYPALALAEIRRVLQPGGRLIICDPYMSLFGWLVYGLTHHEPIGWSRPIELSTNADTAGHDSGYYAAQGNATRIFFRMEHPALLSGWRIVRTRRLQNISYVGSGGFRGPQLYPGFLFPFVSRIDRLLDLIPAVFSTRCLVTLEKIQT